MPEPDEMCIRDSTETAVKQALSDLSGGAQIRLSYSASLSERLGRPVYRATYALSLIHISGWLSAGRSSGSTTTTGI